ncbi:MAG: nuclear transport factor 2 family protein [Lautropia sp.]
MHGEYSIEKKSKQGQQRMTNDISASQSRLGSADLEASASGPLAYEQIRNVVFRETTAFDSGAESEHAACFSDDVRFISTYLGPDGTRLERRNLAGKSNVIELMRKHRKSLPLHCKHVLSSPVIHISGAHATCVTQLFRIDQTESGPKIVSFGQYVDDLRWDRSNGWLISQRVLEGEVSGPPPKAAGA